VLMKPMPLTRPPEGGLLAISALWMVFSVAFYNLLSATGDDRIADIGRIFRHQAAVAPAGTGRLGGLRLRGDAGDYLILCAYFPPRSSMPPATFTECVKKMTEWIHKTMSQVGRRCFPLLVCDANDGLGLARDADGVVGHDPRDELAGQHNWGLEHQTARLLREVMELHHLVAYNTYRKSSPTFFGSDNRSSTIDFVIGPKAGLSLLLSCSARPKEGRLLQVIQTRAPRDHIPLVATFAAKFDSPPPASAAVLDRDAMMAALTKGRGKQEFIEKLEENIRAVSEEEWEKWGQEPVPDRGWQRLAEANNSLAIEAVVLAEGASRLQGPGPKGEMERILQSSLRKLQKQSHSGE